MVHMITSKSPSYKRVHVTSKGPSHGRFTWSPQRVHHIEGLTSPQGVHHMDGSHHPKESIIQMSISKCSSHGRFTSTQGVHYKKDSHHFKKPSYRTVLITTKSSSFRKFASPQGVHHKKRFMPSHGKFTSPQSLSRVTWKVHFVLNTPSHKWHWWILSKNRWHVKDKWNLDLVHCLSMD